MKKDDRAIAIYSRKSKYTGKGESIGNQIELCKEYIGFHFGEAELSNIVIYEDEGFSGGNTNRPSFQSMMKKAEENEIKAVVVYRLDRISRNVSDFSAMITELDSRDIEFISINENFDTRTPMGRAMMYISSVFAQLERETIAERIRDNLHELAKTGRWLGGTTPIGYVSESVESVTIDGKKKKACKLALVPNEAELIKNIFHIFETSNSLTQTEYMLMEQNQKTRNDIDFSRFAIKNILQNPVYMIADEDAYNYLIEKEADLYSDKSDFDGEHGIMAYNRTDQEKGKTTVYRPVDEWIVSVGKHQGVIPGKTWIKVQTMLEQNKNKNYKKPRSHEALLTGKLFCSCGSRMYPKVSRYVDDDGQKVFYYVCKMKEHSKTLKCNNRNVHGNLLDETVVKEIMKLNEDKSAYLKDVKKVKKVYSGDKTDHKAQLAQYRKDKAALEKKIKGAIDLGMLAEGTAKKIILENIAEMGDDMKLIETKIYELEAFIERDTLQENDFEMYRSMIETFAGSVKNGDINTKRSALNSLVRKVVWDGDRAHLVMFGASGDIEYPAIPGLAQQNDEISTQEDLSQSGEDSK